ncbi:MAG: hypothetical protein J6F30_08250 [Cellulosilyticum sp.]|nr:hypothetical protein [Cellulosilyticum sp.]
MAKEVSIKGYQCEKCGKAYAFENQADDCCKEYFCRECGVKLDKYHTLCERCKEKVAYEKAKKMTYEEYVKEYGDNMVVFGDDYYSEIEDVLDYCVQNEIEPPKYVWGTSKQTVKLDADTIEENALSDVFEDAKFSYKGMEELRTFLDEWNKKHRIDYYIEEPIVVYVPEDMLKDLDKQI